MTVRGQLSGADYSQKPDGSQEMTRSGFNMIDVTAANFDAQSTLLLALQTAVQAISLIDYDGVSMYAVDTPPETTQPASAYAQREIKWLVNHTDDVNGRRGSMEIGGADLDQLDAEGANLDITGGVGAAFVTAYEAAVVSRDGNAVTVQSVIHVGRNI